MKIRRKTNEWKNSGRKKTKRVWHFFYLMISEKTFGGEVIRKGIKGRGSKKEKERKHNHDVISKKTKKKFPKNNYKNRGKKKKKGDKKTWR